MSETIVRIRHRDRRVPPRQPLWLPYRHQRHWLSSLANFAPPFHASSSFASPSLVSVHEIGNEPGVHKMEISQAGSSPRNHYCASPMLWRTGLGSNSFTGSPKQAPMGIRPTLTVAVPVFYNTCGAWTNRKVPYCYGAGTRQLCILLREGGVAAP